MACQIIIVDKHHVIIENELDQKIAISSSHDVLSILPGLMEGIYSSSPYRITVSLMVGTLLSNLKGPNTLCGSTIPIPILQALCTSAYSSDNLRAFFKVCATLLPELDVSFTQKSGEKLRNEIIQDSLQQLRSKIVQLRLKRLHEQDITQAVLALRSCWESALENCGVDSVGNDDCAAVSRAIPALFESVRGDRGLPLTDTDLTQLDLQFILNSKKCLEKYCPIAESSPSQSLNGNRTKVPSHQIWPLLILAEFFGVQSVYAECIQKLHGMLCPTHCVCADMHFNSGHSLYGSLQTEESPSAKLLDMTMLRIPVDVLQASKSSENDVLVWVQDIRRHIAVYGCPEKIVRPASSCTATQSSRPEDTFTSAEIASTSFLVNSFQDTPKTTADTTPQRALLQNHNASGSIERKKLFISDSPSIEQSRFDSGFNAREYASTPGRRKALSDAIHLKSKLSLKPQSCVTDDSMSVSVSPRISKLEDGDFVKHTESDTEWDSDSTTNFEVVDNTCVHNSTEIDSIAFQSISPINNTRTESRPSRGGQLGETQALADSDDDYSDAIPREIPAHVKAQALVKPAQLQICEQRLDDIEASPSIARFQKYQKSPSAGKSRIHLRGPYSPHIPVANDKVLQLSTEGRDNLSHRLGEGGPPLQVHDLENIVTNTPEIELHPRGLSETNNTFQVSTSHPQRGNQKVISNRSEMVPLRRQALLTENDQETFATPPHEVQTNRILVPQSAPADFESSEYRRDYLSGKGSNSRRISMRSVSTSKIESRERIKFRISDLDTTFASHNSRQDSLSAVSTKFVADVSNAHHSYRRIALSRIRAVLSREKQIKSELASRNEVRKSKLRLVEIEAEMLRTSMSNLKHSSVDRGKAIQGSNLLPASAKSKRVIGDEGFDRSSDFPGFRDVDSNLSFDAKDIARKLAASRQLAKERIREHRQESAEKISALELLKQQEKWAARNKRLTSFAEKAAIEGSLSNIISGSPRAYQKDVRYSSDRQSSLEHHSADSESRMNFVNSSWPSARSSRIYSEAALEAVGLDAISDDEVDNTVDYKLPYREPGSVNSHISKTVEHARVVGQGGVQDYFDEESVTSFDSLNHSRVDQVLSEVAEVESLIDDVLSNKVATPTSFRPTKTLSSSRPDITPKADFQARLQSSYEDKSIFNDAAPLLHTNASQRESRWDTSSNLFPSKDSTSKIESTPTVIFAQQQVYEPILGIRIRRAHQLVEVLGGTNPYVIVDWGALGHVVTPALRATTNGTFNFEAEFHIPDSWLQNDRQQWLHSNPRELLVRFIIYSRNESLSDEMLGSGNVSVGGSIAEYTKSRGSLEYEPCVQEIICYDVDGNSIGIVDITVSIRLA